MNYEGTVDILFVYEIDIKDFHDFFHFILHNEIFYVYTLN